MRTTIDLPDSLYRTVKANAASRGIKLKDYITEALQNTLTHSTTLTPDSHNLLEKHRLRMQEHFQRMDQGRSSHESVNGIQREDLHNRHA